MYKVIRDFFDLQDNAHQYKAGDAFPRDGYTPTPGRLSALSSEKNRRGIPLIMEIKEETEKPVKKQPAKKKTTKK